MLSALSPHYRAREQGSVNAMIRSVAGKVMWVGRATVFLMGVAVILALLFGVASTAFAHKGNKVSSTLATGTSRKL